MGWLRLVGSLNYRSLLQKSPTKETCILKSGVRTSPISSDTRCVCVRTCVCVCVSNCVCNMDKALLCVECVLWGGYD